MTSATMSDAVYGYARSALRPEHLWHWTIFIVVSLAVATPLIFLVLGSFSEASLPTQFTLSELTLRNYRQVWLDADTLIREGTNGRRSLDDFAKALAAHFGLPYAFAWFFTDGRGCEQAAEGDGHATMCPEGAGRHVVSKPTSNRTGTGLFAQLPRVRQLRIARAPHIAGRAGHCQR